METWTGCTKITICIQRNNCGEHTSPGESFTPSSFVIGQALDFRTCRSEICRGHVRTSKCHVTFRGMWRLANVMWGLSQIMWQLADVTRQLAEVMWSWLAEVVEECLDDYLPHVFVSLPPQRTPKRCNPCPRVISKLEDGDSHGAICLASSKRTHSLHPWSSQVETHSNSSHSPQSSHCFCCCWLLFYSSGSFSSTCFTLSSFDLRSLPWIWSEGWECEAYHRGLYPQRFGRQVCLTVCEVVHTSTLLALKAEANVLATLPCSLVARMW